MIVYRVMAGANAGQSRLVICYRTGSGSGYWTYNGTVGTPGVGGEGAVSFSICLGMYKLIKLDDTGKLKTTLDPLTWALDLMGGVVTLPQNSAYTLQLSPNGFGDDAIHLGTQEGLYFYDESMARVRRTKLILPRIRDQGTSMINHQDNLFVSVDLRRCCATRGTRLIRPLA